MGLGYTIINFDRTAIYLQPIAVHEQMFFNFKDFLNSNLNFYELQYPNRHTEVQKYKGRYKCIKEDLRSETLNESYPGMLHNLNTHYIRSN